MVFNALPEKTLFIRITKREKNIDRCLVGTGIDKKKLFSWRPLWINQYIEYRH